MALKENEFNYMAQKDNVHISGNKIELFQNEHVKFDNDQEVKPVISMRVYPCPSKNLQVWSNLSVTVFVQLTFVNIFQKFMDESF